MINPSLLIVFLLAFRKPRHHLSFRKTPAPCWRPGGFVYSFQSATHSSKDRPTRVGFSGCVGLSFDSTYPDPVPSHHDFTPSGRTANNTRLLSLFAVQTRGSCPSTLSPASWSLKTNSPLNPKPENSDSTRKFRISKPSIIIGFTGTFAGSLHPVE